MELYLDGLSGEPAASVSFGGSSGFTDYKEIEVNIPKISGTHDLYIKFTGGEGYLVNLDSFVFGKDKLPLSGKLFNDVQVTEQAFPDKWAISSAYVGAPVFGDRDFRITQLQSGLDGAEVLMTACDAKGTTGEAASFTAAADMLLYVGLDSRVETPPQWLEDYVLMRTLCTVDDLSFMMYRKDVKAGEKVSLGSNGQTYKCVNYIVMGIPTMEPEPLEGDINLDGSVNVADLVTLQNHLLKKETLSEEQFNAADMNADLTVDVFDMIRLRKQLCNQ